MALTTNEMQFPDLKHEELLPIWKGVAVYVSLHHYNNPRIDSTQHFSFNFQLQHQSLDMRTCDFKLTCTMDNL